MRGLRGRGLGWLFIRAGTGMMMIWLCDVAGERLLDASRLTVGVGGGVLVGTLLWVLTGVHFEYMPATTNFNDRFSFFSL